MSKLPSTEIKWETIANENGDVFIVTSNKERSIYYIYSFDGTEYKKIDKAKTPPELMKHVYKKRGNKT